MEQEYVAGCEAAAGGAAAADERAESDAHRVDDVRGSPLSVGTLEEMIDDDHAIVSSNGGGPEQ
jgi:26S proteasome regulatory subunit T2